MKNYRTILVLLLLGNISFAQSNYADLKKLSDDFWKWRAVTQPLSGDDINRIERPAGWVPDWSVKAVNAMKDTFQLFLTRWESMDTAKWPVSQKVDYHLVGSAISRVEWELTMNPTWRTNPVFYLNQSLGSIFEILLPPPPIKPERAKEIVLRMKNIPAVLNAAKNNLQLALKPFAALAITDLQTAGSRLDSVSSRLAPLFPADQATELAAATKLAMVALNSYKQWLESRLPKMRDKTAIGVTAYNFFLTRVAQIPYTPDQLVEMARQEWERAVAFEVYESLRNNGKADLPLAAGTDAQIKNNENAERSVRQFLEEKNILTVPSSMQHYQNREIPGYLAPLADMGVVDDLTSATRLKENATKYIPKPDPGSGYFNVATAKDSRPILVHEGIPGHYFQLARSWAHPNPVRRYYYDSGANEGIGFYAEEMMLQMGYFDDSPRTREIIYNFMRLRALRVEVDVKLATGAFTIDQAAAYLEKKVPMDAQTAKAEAAFFASAPGQAISYQIGKIQIQQMLSEAKLSKGAGFSLRDFHDFVWLNGNVPVALQRWEYLGDNSQIQKMEAAKGKIIRSTK